MPFGVTAVTAVLGTTHASSYTDDKCCLCNVSDVVTVIRHQGRALRYPREVRRQFLQKDEYTGQNDSSAGSNGRRPDTRQELRSIFLRNEQVTTTRWP